MPRCKNCKNKFEPRYFLQKFCMDSDECIKAFAVWSKVETDKRVNKEWREEKKALREKLKTHKDYLNDLQITFNTFVRQRDKFKGCISCGKDLTLNKYDAGHFYSVGGNPALRFNEDNTHGQCVFCNQHKHGNLLEYAERLPARIGLERFENLKAKKNDTLKLSIPELIAWTAHYKAKIKILSEK